MTKSPSFGARDPSSGHAKQILLGYLRRIRALRDQRREINEDIAEVRKEAKDAGFSARRIEEVVRWQEECEKHGREVVDEAEALFDLYRMVADGQGLAFDEMMDDARDRALVKMFAGEDQTAPKPPTAKVRAASDAAIAAQIDRMTRGGG
ncbi:GapR family DNA-binding domain-containing protein [Croceicoccus naphthovorans]|uniref:Uncharacterized protein n=1 Tax=Croceicoccus naphthovorans TaxID=1348774 RepID=A0A0G3XE90_9SPHN|nr:GapR family DNA-binding domain-containing protein [Croceicoccus naphthovorans]AKM09865.1 hypothetical protein AB433_07510 [Croceicoccus naphthovorans]MBB3991319.1 uncharacterized protein (UPF0335 family) [Croceicoccus naphthovorans]